MKQVRLTLDLSNFILDNEESNQDEVLDSDSVESHHKTNSISSRKEHFPWGNRYIIIFRLPCKEKNDRRYIYNKFT